MDSSDYRNIRQLFDDYLRMYSSRDDRLTTYFSEDFSGFTGGGDFLVKDREDWIAITRQDFAQVEDPIHIELKDLAIQSLADTVAVATCFFTIHLPIEDHVLSRETARLVLIFRKESAGWKISHSSISIPYGLVREGEVYPLKELEVRNRFLEEMIAERTIQLSNSNDNLQQTNDELAREIVEHKQAEVEREQFFRFFTTSTDLKCIADPNGAFLKINPACAETLGYSEAELVSKPFVHFVHPADKQHTLDEIKRQLEIGHSLNFENRYICKDGSSRWLSWRAIYNKDDHTTYATARDITGRKLMESQLQESEAHYRLLTEGVSDVVWKLDSNYRFTYVSPADERLRGYSACEVIGLTIFELTTNEGVATLAERFGLRREAEQNGTNAGSETFELQQRCRDGRLIWTEIIFASERDAGGTITGYHGVTRDITQRKQALKLELQLFHAQKLESLGVLAGGIAHDFNNILMAIIGNADLAMMRISEESPAVENLRRIEQAATRAADLTKQMLAYSGKGKFVVENLDLNRLVEKMLPLLEVSISKKAQLRLNLLQPLPSVEADATQMHQIIMNLVINASEAIEPMRGMISITTGCIECDRNYLKDVWLDEKISEGLYVCLEITDTGCGMDRETTAKLFDPFFTTKFTGRGLGLAAVLGIIKGHKGAIKVRSEPGKGTTFQILLPASGQIADLPNQATPSFSWHGSGTVLLVDDEETVRGTGVEMLKELGFTPITANDGVEAITVFKETPALSFVILDLTMPLMDGEQCFRELCQLDPMVKVIMSSGYNEQEVTRKFAGKGPSGFIQKPYNLSMLRDVIRSVA